jgi:hypothetical protein
VWRRKILALLSSVSSTLLLVLLYVHFGGPDILYEFYFYSYITATFSELKPPLKREIMTGYKVQTTRYW